ncbi:MAG: alternate-type signal peptide domain-containing protein [Bifidobacteriaceae bacterium]|jgi:alternate signal-mediated exported protein|nr:alternate-type signal peptide domain-containing protein [Bifidobacteriaceae bacterium]
MTINPATERERRSRRFKGLVAGAAGIALLLGGATFAMWSDSEEADVAKVQHGTLDVVENDVSGVYDLRRDANSEDGEETGSLAVKDAVEIPDLANFPAVPGDKIEIVLPVKVDAVGDNMNYELTLHSVTPFADLHWTAWVNLYDMSGNVARAYGQVNLTEPDGPLHHVDGVSLGWFTPTDSTWYQLSVVVELESDNLRNQDRIEGSVDEETDKRNDFLGLKELVVTATQYGF